MTFPRARSASFVASVLFVAGLAMTSACQFFIPVDVTQTQTNSAVFCDSNATDSHNSCGKDDDQYCGNDDECHAGKPCHPIVECKTSLDCKPGQGCKHGKCWESTPDPMTPGWPMPPTGPTHP
jgi:hypothetical protein